MIYITQIKSLCTEELTLIDELAIPTYIHQVMTDRDRKLINMGAKSNIQVLMENLLRGNEFDGMFDGSGSGAFYAAGNARGVGVFTTFETEPENLFTLKNPSLAISNIVSTHVLKRVGEFEQLYTDSTACISTMASLQHAMLMIETGKLKRALVISAEHSIGYDLIEFFTRNGICKTLDDDTRGFYLGEGSNYIVLESAESLKETNNTPIAELLDVSTFHESHSSPIGIDPTGIGYREIIKRAMKVEPNIDFVNLHATGTEDNSIEEVVVNELIPNAIKLKYKDKIGHTLGSNGGIELDLGLRDSNGVMITLAAGMGNVFGSILTRKI